MLIEKSAFGGSKRRTCYRLDSSYDSWMLDTTERTVPQPRIQSVVQNAISHFLPAQYPDAVSIGYLHFASYSFLASVAGSAGMVLSTQTLLLAVGVAGSTESVSVMAGALNWVLKDGVGQLGGVLFASFMGKMRQFDDHPKQWRLTGAMALDASNFVEIMSPLLAGPLVLPVACLSNAVKNASFLAIGASRAALHACLAKDSNLADVTAKAGSQAMLASLLGTSLGIGLSTLLEHDPSNFVIGFCALSGVHQFCNYKSLQQVAMDRLDRHRLYILVQEYIRHKRILTPSEVAAQEVYFPLAKADDLDSWLRVGVSVAISCPGGPGSFIQRKKFLEVEQYLVTHHEDSPLVHVIFGTRATSEDIIYAMLHAVELHTRHTEQKATNPLSTQSCRRRHPSFFRDVTLAGWTTDTGSTNIEHSSSLRVEIRNENSEKHSY